MWLQNTWTWTCLCWAWYCILYISPEAFLSFCLDLLLLLKCLNFCQWWAGHQRFWTCQVNLLSSDPDFVGNALGLAIFQMTFVSSNIYPMVSGKLSEGLTHHPAWYVGNHLQGQLYWRLWHLLIQEEFLLWLEVGSVVSSVPCWDGLDQYRLLISHWVSPLPADLKPSQSVPAPCRCSFSRQSSFDLSFSLRAKGTRRGGLITGVTDLSTSRSNLPCIQPWPLNTSPNSSLIRVRVRSAGESGVTCRATKVVETIDWTEC